jgi:hypothetical protein
MLAEDIHYAVSRLFPVIHSKSSAFMGIFTGRESKSKHFPNLLTVKAFSLSLVTSCSFLWLHLLCAEALPPPRDVPEEILQNSLLWEGTSPIDSTNVSAQTYAVLEEKLQLTPEDVPARINPKLKQTVDLLRLRKLLKTILPFLIP